jgi:hypothetical protein
MLMDHNLNGVWSHSVFCYGPEITSGLEGGRFGLGINIGAKMALLKLLSKLELGFPDFSELLQRNCRALALFDVQGYISNMEKTAKATRTGKVGRSNMALKLCQLNILKFASRATCDRLTALT